MLNFINLALEIKENFNSANEIEIIQSKLINKSIAGNSHLKTCMPFLWETKILELLLLLRLFQIFCLIMIFMFEK